MNEKGILRRTQELLDERGELLDECLKATRQRNIEISERFDEIREELQDLLKRNRLF